MNVTTDRAYQLKRLAELRTECAKLAAQLHGRRACGTHYCDIDRGNVLEVTFNVRHGAVEIASVTCAGVDLTPLADHIRDLQDEVQQIHDYRQSPQAHAEHMADVATEAA